MRSHLTKLSLFLGLQAVIAAVALAIASGGAKVDPEAPPHERFAAVLKRELYAAWLRDPEALRRIADEGPANIEFRRAAERFRVEQDGYLASAIDKDRRLRTAEGRRLILLGGSNLAFGMDSRLLAERYGLNPVNLAIHGALRSGYLLRQAAAHVRRGDVVVLCFEYDSFLGGPETEPHRRDELCRLHPPMRDYFEAEPSPQDSSFTAWKTYGDRTALSDFAAATRDVAGGAGSAVGTLFLERLRRPFTSGTTLRAEYDAAFAAVEPRLAAGERPWLDPANVYGRTGFNEYGDFVGHYGRTSAKAKSLRGGKRSPLKQDDRAGLAASLAAVNDFAATCRSRGAEVYFAFPPLLRIGGEDRFGPSYTEAVAAGTDVPILFPIEQSYTTSGEHYDSAMHLNWRGVRRRMEVWATALDRHLEPVVPLSPAEHVAARDRAVRATVLAELPEAAEATPR